ncbi:MAG: hypothetical protein ACR2NZ_20130 [Rubripirellula sp.]
MTDVSAERIAEKLFTKSDLDETQQYELMAFAVAQLCTGTRPSKIYRMMVEAFPELQGQLNRETPMNLILLAASKGYLEFQAPFKNQLGWMLAHESGWADGSIAVVHSRELEHLARETAKELLKQIRQFRTFGNLRTVHIGFAGGRLLRLVAKNLADLLQTPSPQNPDKLVFHAMVAAFNENDFESDPNNFITYFLQKPMPIDISFIPIAAPGIVEVKHRKELRKFREIEGVYKAARKLNIIVSSGGDWADAHSTTQRYLQEVDQSDVDALREYPAIGDLLWQPISAEGPIDMDGGDFTFRPNTLVDLSEIPSAIEERGLRVLLALGTCGRCGKPKGNLLNTILGLDQQLVTDVVTNSPTAYDALKLRWNASPPNVRKTK